MHAKSSLRALLPFLFPFIHLSIAGVIPTSEDFFTTDSLLPSFDSNFNGGSNPKTAIALAPTTDPSQAASQVEFSNFGTDLFAESPSTIYDQEGQQGAASGQFVVPDTNTFPNLDQSSPNQLPASAPLNTVDTKPLPGPNTAVCKNPKETIPVCHNMHERTLLPPPLDIEMATTISPTRPYCPGLDDLLWCCTTVEAMPRGGIPEYDAQKVNHWYGVSCHPTSQNSNS